MFRTRKLIHVTIARSTTEARSYSLRSSANSIRATINKDLTFPPPERYFTGQSLLWRIQLMIIKLTLSLVCCCLRMWKPQGSTSVCKPLRSTIRVRLYVLPCLSTPVMDEVIRCCHAINRIQEYSVRMFLHCGATWESCSQDRLAYPANHHPQQLCTGARTLVGW